MTIVIIFCHKYVRRTYIKTCENIFQKNDDVFEINFQQKKIETYEHIKNWCCVWNKFSQRLLTFVCKCFEHTRKTFTKTSTHDKKNNHTSHLISSSFFLLFFLIFHVVIVEFVFLQWRIRIFVDINDITTFFQWKWRDFLVIHVDRLIDEISFIVHLVVKIQQIDTCVFEKNLISKFVFVKKYQTLSHYKLNKCIWNMSIEIQKLKYNNIDIWKIVKFSTTTHSYRQQTRQI